MIGTSGGPGPAQGRWHHVAYTFNGATQTTYLNGNVNYVNQWTLSIDRVVNFFVGSYFDGGFGDGGQLGVGAVRVHDGVLSAADVLNNYLLDSGS